MQGLKNIRLKQYDYGSNGYYFVTIVADKRQQFLVGNEDLIMQELDNLKLNTKGLDIDYYVTMSNHVHIIFILNDCSLKLGEIVRRFKSRITYELKKKIWQPNYYEHVIRNEAALEKIREYVIYNPDLELIKFEKFYN